MTKQLLIIYDEKLKDCATILYNLLSQHPNIKSSIYTEKEISTSSTGKEVRKLVSREKCLYIGENCSSELRFDDCYNNLGINIGYIGAKAWIRCYKHKWDVDSLNEFENMLKSFTDKYKLKKEYEKYETVGKALVYLSFQFGLEPWPDNAKERISIKDIDIIKKSVPKPILNMYNSTWFQQLNGGYDYIYKYVFKNVGGDDNIKIRWYQYLLGVLKFYDDYLNDFLELSDSNKESSDEDTITGSEKKTKYKRNF